MEPRRRWMRHAEVGMFASGWWCVAAGLGSFTVAAAEHVPDWLFWVILAFTFGPLLVFRWFRDSPAPWQPVVRVSSTRVVVVRCALAAGVIAVAILGAAARITRSPLTFVLLFATMVTMWGVYTAAHWGLRPETFIPQSWRTSSFSPWGPDGPSVFRPGGWLQTHTPPIPVLTKPPQVSVGRWRSEMRRLCGLIARQTELERVWLGIASDASIPEDYIALHYAIFTDLESERCARYYSQELPQEQWKALRRFLDAVHRFDR